MGRIRDKLSGTPRCSMCGGPSPGVGGMCGSCARATGTKPKNQLRTKAGRESQRKKDK